MSTQTVVENEDALVELGWIRIDPAPRGFGSAKRHAVAGVSMQVNRVTLLAARYFAKRMGQDVTRTELADHLRPFGFGANSVSIVLGQLKAVLSLKYSDHKAGQILDSRDAEIIRFNEYNPDFVFTPEPRPQAAPRPVEAAPAARPPVKPRVRAVRPDDEDDLESEPEDLRPIDELIRSVRVRGGASIRDDAEMVEDGDDREDEAEEEEEEDNDEAPPQQQDSDEAEADAVKPAADTAAADAETKPEAEAKADAPAPVPAPLEKKTRKARKKKEPAKAAPVQKEKLPPSARTAFSKVRGELPARLDTGDFVVTLNTGGKGHAALINGTRAGITEAEYGILVDLFNARGTVLTSLELGQKYFRKHDRPTGTVASAMFKIRAALKKAEVECHESMITTVKGSGFQYTGPNAPGVK